MSAKTGRLTGKPVADRSEIGHESVGDRSRTGRKSDGKSSRTKPNLVAKDSWCARKTGRPSDPRPASRENRRQSPSPHDAVARPVTSRENRSRRPEDRSRTGRQSVRDRSRIGRKSTAERTEIVTDQPNLVAKDSWRARKTGRAIRSSTSQPTPPPPYRSSPSTPPTPPAVAGRGHGFPRSHGPTEPKLNAPWLTPRCRPAARTGASRARTANPNEPEARRSPDESAIRQPLGPARPCLREPERSRGGSHRRSGRRKNRANPKAAESRTFRIGCPGQGGYWTSNRTSSLARSPRRGGGFTVGARGGASSEVLRRSAGASPYSVVRW